MHSTVLAASLASPQVVIIKKKSPDVAQCLLGGKIIADWRVIGVEDTGSPLLFPQNRVIGL